MNVETEVIESGHHGIMYNGPFFALEHPKHLS